MKEIIEISVFFSSTKSVILGIIFKQTTLYNKDWRTSRSSGGKQDYAKEKQIQSLNIN